jgi:molybdate transport system permease protein
VGETHQAQVGETHQAQVGETHQAQVTLTPEEWQAVHLSLSVALRSVTFGTPLAVLAAYVLSRHRFYGRPILEALVHLPLVLPPVVTGYLLLILFGVRGPLGGLLNDWFGVRLVFTTPGAALATAVMSFPLIVRAVRLSFDALDTGLEDAARTLGAAPLDRFLTVTLPLVAPGILAGAITAFAAGLGEFGAVITFASNIPGETQTLPLAIYTATQQPGGDATAAKLAAISFSLAIAGLLLAEIAGRRLARFLGRAA